MQFSINRDRFYQGLKQMETAMPHRNQYLHDMFYHVLIHADATSITLTVTDGGMTVSLYVTETVVVAEPGACTAQYDLLLEALKPLPKQAGLLVTQGKGTVDISWGELTTSVERGDASLFPAPKAVPAVGMHYDEERFVAYVGHVPDLKRQTATYTYEVLQAHQQQLTLPQEALLAMVERAALAASTAKEPRKQIYRAVYVSVKDDRLTLAATDGSRTNVQQADLLGAGSWVYDALIPARELALVLHLLPASTPVALEACALTRRLVKRDGQEIVGCEPETVMPQVCLKASHWMIQLAPLTGRFPDLSQIFTQEATTRVVCEAAQLLSVVEEIAPLAKKAGDITRFHVEDTTIRVEVRSEQCAEPVVREIPVARTGESMSIIFNCCYILDVLRSIQTENVVFTLSSPKKMGVFRPEGDDHAVYTIMPLTTNR